MANDDDDVDASRCVPPAGTKVALCKLAAHTVMNEQCGTIAGYSAEADRYVVQLEDGTRVRVCRGNLRLEALTTYDFAHAIGETCTAFSRLAARHGASMTSELVGALLQLPNCEWTVMKDLVAVDYAWAARTQEGDSLHSLGAPPSHKAQKTNSTSYMYMCLQHRPSSTCASRDTTTKARRRVSNSRGLSSCCSLSSGCSHTTARQTSLLAHKAHFLFRTGTCSFQTASTTRLRCRDQLPAFRPSGRCSLRHGSSTWESSTSRRSTRCNHFARHRSLTLRQDVLSPSLPFSFPSPPCR